MMYLFYSFGLKFVKPAIPDTHHISFYVETPFLPKFCFVLCILLQDSTGKTPLKIICSSLDQYNDFLPPMC